MQCQEELVPYQRMKVDKPLRLERARSLPSGRRVLFYVAVLLLSRAIMVNTLMPFGIAIFIAAFHAMKLEAALLTGVLAAAGSLSLIGSSQSVNGLTLHSVSNLLVLALMMMAALFFKSFERNRVLVMSIFACFMNIIVDMVVQILFVSASFQLYDFLLALMESAMIVAMAFIFTYGIPIYLESGKRRKLSKEETVCLGFILAIVVSGIWNKSVLGLSPRDMTSYFIILAAGYLEGPMAGAAFGIVLGAVPGAAGMELQTATLHFGLCGLLGGMFKSIGKSTCAAAFLLSYLLVSTFTAGLSELVAGLCDIAIPSILFLLIPQAWFNGLTGSIEELEEKPNHNEALAAKTRDIMNRKLTAISGTLGGLSDVLSRNVESELSCTGEITGMAEKLADRVCRNCSSRDSCWNRELYHTFEAVKELLVKNEQCGMLEFEQMPKHLRYKCIRSNEMIRQSNYIYEIFKLNNKWKRKLVNSKLIVSEQMKGITGIMSSLAAEVLATVEFRSDIEEQLAIALDRNGLLFEDVLVARNGRGKHEVSIYRKRCEGEYECKRNFAAIVSGALGKRMANESGSCRIDENNHLCNFRFIEADNYSIATAVSRLAKEEISGDSHSYGCISDGRYLMALSDGMGSGHRAALESSTTIQLLEQFMEAGFERSAALKAINSVLVLRSSEECFATIDMGVIDLYSGVGEFVKIGAAPTFIKSGMEIEVIRSTGVPAGILDEIDIESQIVSFKNGDMIVMVSDGIVDADRDLSESWVTRTLREYNSGNPKDVADHILSKARSFYGDTLKDDMTVMVAKIWKIY